MKHLKTFNESAGDLAGKKPKGMSNNSWDVLKKMLNRGFVKNYTFEDYGWSESSKLTALADITGVFDDEHGSGKRKMLTLTMFDNSIKEIEFIEKDDTLTIYPKDTINGRRIYTGTPDIKHFKHYVPLDPDEFSELKYASADYVQQAKKNTKTILDPNNIAHPNEDIKKLLKQYSPSYNKLISVFGFHDVTTMRQAKNGSVELANQTRFGMRPFYTIVKTGKIYNKLNQPVSTIYTTPPLLKIEDYERCFDFLVKREEKKKLKK